MSVSCFLLFVWAFSFSVTTLVQTCGYNNEKYPPFWKAQLCNLQTAVSALMLVSCTPSPSLRVPWKACQLGDQRVCEDVPVQSCSFNQAQSPVHAVINEENSMAKWCGSSSDSENGSEKAVLIYRRFYTDKLCFLCTESSLFNSYLSFLQKCDWSLTW